MLSRTTIYHQNLGGVSLRCVSVLCNSNVIALLCEIWCRYSYINNLASTSTILRFKNSHANRASYMQVVQNFHCNGLNVSLLFPNGLPSWPCLSRASFVLQPCGLVTYGHTVAFSVKLAQQVCPYLFCNMIMLFKPYLCLTTGAYTERVEKCKRTGTTFDYYWLIKDIDINQEPLRLWPRRPLEIKCCANCNISSRSLVHSPATCTILHFQFGGAARHVVIWPLWRRWSSRKAWPRRQNLAFGSRLERCDC